MRRTALLLILLAGCVDPRTACLRDATEELTTLDKLIVETEGNLRRGYAIEREQVVVSGVTFCLGGADQIATGAKVGVRFCNELETEERERPVPIDRAAEQRKLADLRTSRRSLVRQTQARIDACQAAYPAPVQ